jgi:hypothetical protein
MTTTALTPQEESDAAEMLADLHESGYINVEQHGGLKAGTRVRHIGHKWPTALLEGSGNVVALTEKPQSSWSQSWGKPDVELIVAWDEPQGGSRLSQLAQYHVEVMA